MGYPRSTDLQRRACLLQLIHQIGKQKAAQMCSLFYVHCELAVNLKSYIIEIFAGKPPPPAQISKAGNPLGV